MRKIENCDNELSLLVECEGCGKKFNVSSQGEALNVRHKKEYVVNGKVIYLTYYDCLSCGRRHFVQVDDKRTLEVLKATRRMFTKLAAKRVSDKHIPQKQLDKYRKQTKHLSNCRIELMKKFTGVMLHNDETDTDFELRFSV